MTLIFPVTTDKVDMPANSVAYYFSDHLGSAEVITNASGAIVKESDYLPYGYEKTISGSDSNHYKFTGKERDSESGLDNFGARYYASTTGRFMSPDWAARPTAVPYAVFGDPQSLNLYGYVRNDPVTQADADGHDTQAVAAADPTDSGQGGYVKQTAPEVQTKDAKQAEAKQDKTTKTDKAQNPSQAGTTIPFPVIPTLPSISAGIRALVTVAADAISTTAVTVAATAAYLISPPSGSPNQEGTIQSHIPASVSAQGAVNTAPMTSSTSKGGLPPGAVKLKGNQGYRDSNGNTWRKDMLQDVVDRKGNKIREVTFDGRQLWPDGPKNNQ